MNSIEIVAEIQRITQAEIDIEALEGDRVYSKTELSKDWRIDRKTVARWHRLAIDHAPGYSGGFSKALIVGTCQDCNSNYQITFLQFQSARRRYPITCPHCKSVNVPDTKQIETTDEKLKIPGNYAKILRLVGDLICSFGREDAIAMLTIHPKYKDLRQFIRQQLIYTPRNRRV